MPKTREVGAIPAPEELPSFKPLRYTTPEVDYIFKYSDEFYRQYRSIPTGINYAIPYEEVRAQGESITYSTPKPDIDVEYKTLAETKLSMFLQDAAAARNIRDHISEFFAKYDRISRYQSLYEPGYYGFFS